MSWRNSTPSTRQCEKMMPVDSQPLNHTRVTDQNQCFLPWSNSVSQGRLWKMRIICCLWLASLNKKAAALAQLALGLSGFAGRRCFLTSGKEMCIPSLPHIGSQSDLRFSSSIWFKSNLFWNWGLLFWKGHNWASESSATRWIEM